MTGQLVKLVAMAALVLGGLMAAPAQAGPNELALLTSYVGEWSGAGVLEGGKKPESFRCRLTIGKGNQAKINYAGRCTLVSINLSVTGTIAYDDDSHTYQAVMSSNAGFDGNAVGRKQGDKIVFDLAERQSDKGGNDVRIASRITLVGAQQIIVDFQVEFNNSGHLLTATVPFAK